MGLAFKGLRNKYEALIIYSSILLDFISIFIRIRYLSIMFINIMLFIQQNQLTRVAKKIIKVTEQ